MNSARKKLTPEQRERKRESARKWHAANPERRRENNRKWRKANLKHVREHDRKRYAA